MRKSISYILVLVIISSLLGCKPKEAFLEFKEEVFTFELGEEVKLEDLDLVNKETLKADEVFIGEIDTSTVTAENKELVVKATLNNKEKEFVTYYQVVDTVAPIITGDNTFTVEEGSTLTKEELISKFKAEDLSDVVVDIEGDYDLLTPGTYELVATATDTSDNKTSVEFTLEVTKKKVVEQPTKPAAKPQTNTKPNMKPSTGNSNNSGNSGNNTGTVTPPKPAVACPGAWSDETKPCDWIHPNMRAVDEKGRTVPMFKTSKEAWDWGEKNARGDTWYGCRGFDRAESYYNDGTRFYFAYMHSCDN